MARALLVALVLVAGGCTKTWHGTATQPNPLKHPTETLRDSEPIVIITGDMELRVPRPAEDQQIRVESTKPYPLDNEASFSVVSRDRLRFHVQLEHKWQDWADPANWEVTLVDDQGRQWTPETVEHNKPKLLTQMWDQEQRSYETNVPDGAEYGRGDIVAIHDDAYKHRSFLGSLSVFRGRADFEFYQRDLFTADVKSLTLIVRKPGYRFEFRWDFADSVVASGD
jgi:hypothetical protein